VDDLLTFVRGRIKDGNLGNMVIFSGTIPVLGDKVLAGSGFEVELFNPVNGDSLWCRYQIEVLAYI
jgi:hypothetical protein